MIRNIKIWFLFEIAAFKRMLIYRVDCIVGMISQIAFQVIELMFIWIIFQNTDSIGNWNFEQLLLLYGIMMLSIAVTDLLFDATYNLGNRLIKNGKFDTILLRPVHPLISVLGESQATTALGYIVLSVVLIITMLIKLQISINAFIIFKILYFGIFGGFIIGGIQALFGVAGFWTYKSNEVVWSVFQLHKLAEYPIEIYNKFVRILITFIIPFSFAAYYPAKNILEGEGNMLLIILPVITIIIWFITIKVWNWALNKYRSTGN